MNLSWVKPRRVVRWVTARAGSRHHLQARVSLTRIPPILCLVAALGAGCGPDYMPAPVVLGTTTSTIRLTPEQPVAVAEVIVEAPNGAGSNGAIVAVRSDTYPVRVASGGDGIATRFVDPLYSPAYRLGATGPDQPVFRRRVLVWITDPAKLPTDVQLTVDVTTAPRVEAPSALANTTAVTATWSAANTPSIVSRVVTGELPLADGATANATLQVAFDPGAVRDPANYVPTWWVEARIVPTSNDGPTRADLIVRPGTSGFSVTLSSGTSRTIYQPDTITCTADAPCRLDYRMEFMGNQGQGIVHWKVTGEIVDFAGPPPAERAVDVVVGGVPSKAQAGASPRPNRDPSRGRPWVFGRAESRQH